MKRLFAVLCLIALVCFPAAARAEGEQEAGKSLLYNGDFSVQSEAAGLPAGWTLEAYYADYAKAYAETDADMGGIVVLESVAKNDARVCQTVEVLPNTCYRLAAMVRTENVTGGTGCTLSVDNYALDGTYCYSENVLGTNEWGELVLYVRTGAEQTQLRVALRLGGYGMMAEGLAAFSQLTLTAEEPADDADLVIDLSTENGHLAESDSAVQTRAEADSNAVLTAILMVSGLLAFAFALYYRNTLRYEGRTLPGDDAENRMLLPILFVFALLFRVVLSLIFYGHPTDVACFTAWGNAALANGLSNFYTSGMFADYPPGYMYVCYALSWLCRLLGLSYGSNAMALVFKLPGCVADLLSAFVLYRIARQNGTKPRYAELLTGLLLFCPVLMYVTGAWGQIDSILTLGIVLSFWLLQQEKRIPAGALYGLTILMKPQALMFGPLLAVAYIVTIFEKDWKKRLLHTVLAVLSALAVMLLLSLPFRGTQEFDWLIGKYVGTATSYPYASIEAFNLPSLLGGNWKSVDMEVLGVPYRAIGTVFIGLSVLAGCALYVYARKEKGALYLSAAFMLLAIFTFGHYMHERYMIPALLLLLMAYVFYRDRRILIAFGGLCSISLLNILCAFYVVNHQQARGTLYAAITAVGSAAMILLCVYLGYVCWRVMVRRAPLAPLGAPKQEDPETAEHEAADDAADATPLPPLQERDKHWFTKRDWICMLTLTAVYGVFALLNLGTLKAPQTYWEATQPGESFTVEFPQDTHVTSYWVYGNIENTGVLLLSADGYEETYSQRYDNMFRWHETQTDFTAREVRLTLYSGQLKLNEMTFLDENGDPVPVTVRDASGTQGLLFDEQDTVPDAPSYFNGMYFDELYHGRTAYEHLHNLKPYENSHPPLGKIFIMIGIAIFGMCPFGWRIMGALFGVGMLPAMYCFGKRMFKRTEYAFLTAALFAFDFMHFTQTRIATVDVFAVFFIILMFYFMYRYLESDFFGDFRGSLRPLALAGVFFGLGTASKWICIYAGAGLAILFFGSLIDRYAEYARAMKHGTAQEKLRVKNFYDQCIATILWCLLFYILVPGTIYYLSYLPYYIYEAGQDGSYGLIDTFKTLAGYQEFMFSYHSGLTATHAYQSSWYQWPFTGKPMWYYFSSGTGYISTMSASGNPAVWWVSTVGALGLLISALCGQVKRSNALYVLLIGVLANYLPWVLVTRCTFIYHFFATVPFILLAAVYLLKELEREWRGFRVIGWVWLVAAAALFILLYPGLSGLPVSPEWASFIKQLPGGGLMYGA